MSKVCDGWTRQQRFDQQLRESYERGVMNRRDLQLTAKARNKPCTCGSGRKLKKCLPSHPFGDAELAFIWSDALHEDYTRGWRRENPGVTVSTVLSFVDMVAGV